MLAAKHVVVDPTVSWNELLGHAKESPLTSFQPGFGHVAMHRGADPLEIARLIVFLASDESSFSTGAEFVADGGESAGNAAFLAA